MPPPVAAPPAKPAAAPVKPPASTAPPAGAAPPSNEPGGGAIDDGLYGAGAEIDELDGKETVQPPVIPPKPAAAKPKKEDEADEGDAPPGDDEPPKPKTVDEEIQELDEEDHPGDEHPKPPAEKTPTKARDLKVVYEQVKAEKKTLETKLAEATAELERARKTNPDEVKALQDQLQQARQEAATAQEELRYINYAKHPEFVEKYQRPYVAAWEAALADISELQVTEPDGSTRKAGQADMLELAQMPYGQAVSLAEKRFGPVAASQLMFHRQKILELSRAQTQALEKAKTDAGEREKTREADHKAMSEKLSKVWQDELASFAKRFPKWANPVEGDTEGNALLTKGLQEVDQFFNDQKLSHEDRVKLHVRIRAKAANHDRMALRLKRILTANAKLKSKLKEFEDAEPPTGRAGKLGSKSGNGGNVFETAAAEIEALDEPGRSTF